MSLLSVRDLNVRFATPDGEVHAVKDLNFDIDEGETLGIVGESGSGKSQTVLSLLGLLADNGSAQGSASFDGRNLLELNEYELRSVRGRRISMIFQDPMTSMNPYLTIADQMTQVLRQHEATSRQEARNRCIEMLDAVRIPEAAARFDSYPHELSGGMRQRVMIASSLLMNPQILIADEPTTALDVTVQAQILELMRDLNQRLGTAIILITHDLGVVAGLCERVLVMSDGELKESGSVGDIFYRPRDAYTKALLSAVPRLDEARVERLASLASTDESISADRIEQTAANSEELLGVDGLKVHFAIQGDGWFGGRQQLKAVDGVHLSLREGETLGIVGESGCGKSTLARAILRLVPATAGRVCLLGRDMAELDRESLRATRRELQVIFQDPLASLNPRMTVGDIVSEPLWTHRPELNGDGVRVLVVEMLERVGLSGRELNRYPHEFSGGQCQRIGIARALVLRPRVIVCDEPVSALDVSIQAQIVNLRARERELLSGDLPSPLDPPSGCRFRTRCHYAQARCAGEIPQLRAFGPGQVACHRAEELIEPG